jgi:polysaccharide biosynthesis PFTS motif protein
MQIVHELIRRRRRRRLGAMLRGYRLLKRSSNLGLVRRIKSALVDTRLDLPNGRGSDFMLGAASEHAELAARQYVLAWFGGPRLYKALMLSLGSGDSRVVFPLPRAWQDVLIQHGFAVARMRCSLAWVACIAGFWAYGVFRTGRDVAESLHWMVRSAPAHRAPYAPQP